MHAHWIEVFDRADDDAVVPFVAHHLHLELFPAEQRFFNQQFVGRRQLQPVLADGDEFFVVVGNAAAGAASVKLGRITAWKPTAFCAASASSSVLRDGGARGTETNLGHRLLELEAILRSLDGMPRWHQSARRCGA